MNPQKFDKQCIEPFFKDNSNVISVASSNEYAAYLCVYLLSLKEHARDDKYYDIVILERDISNDNKRKIVSCVKQDNISIRFYNPSNLFQGVNLHISHDYFKEECYYRVASPAIFNTYRRVIFTDLDLILQDDISKLYDFDLQGNAIAAAIEPVWREIYDTNYVISENKIRDYTNEVLGLTNPYDYFNTGVCIFDVEQCNKENLFNNIVSLINKNKFIYQEQCAINVYFRERITKLPPVWNFELIPELHVSDNYTQYREFEDNAHLLHYLGKRKPWNDPQAYRAESWWSYARLSPFYEIILYNMVAQRSVNLNSVRRVKDISSIYVLQHSWYYKIKKLRYKIMKAISFGQRHLTYKKKYDHIKNLLKDAKSIKKTCCNFLRSYN